MNNLEYWRAREEAALSLYLRTDEEIERKIHEIYTYLYDSLTKQINGFYQRYATAEGITMAEAQQRVSKMDVEAFAAKAKKYVKEKDFSAQANQELRLYNATMRINRLELLKAEMGLEMVDAFNDLEDLMGESLTDRALDEFRRQAGILGESVNNNERWASEIVNASFHNATWSQRIWMYQTDLKNELSMLLTDGIIQGRNPRELAPHLSKMFGVSQRDAFRLMRTEMARVQEDVQKRAYNEAQIEQFVFIATEDAKTCEICGAMDGEIFEVKSMMPGENCAPMHPNCRCSTAAYINRRMTEIEYFNLEEEFTIDQKQDTINMGDSKVISEISNYFSTNTSEATPGDSLAKYTDENGQLTPDREVRHKAIIDEFILGKERANGQPEYLIMGGGPASGKSTAINKGAISLPNSAVVVDSDAIKGKLPEYTEGLKYTTETAPFRKTFPDGPTTVAGFVHEESSALAKRIISIAQNEDLNCVLDGTGDGSVKGLMKKITSAREQGYKVTGRYVTVPTEVAVERARVRGEKTGRKIDESIITGTHHKVSVCLAECAQYFDDVELWDMSGDPVLIAVGGNGQGLTAIEGQESLLDAFLKK